MDTPYLYLTNPDEEKEYRNNEQQKRFCEFKDILSQMVLVDKSKCKEVTYEGKRWLYVKSYYYQQNKIIYNYGWIEYPKEEELFSAHCWNKFGFTRQDAEDHRIYPIEGVNHYGGTSEFIKKMISLLDKNGDKIIDNKELRAKYNSPDTYHILSKMVCKHQSEWSYSWERIKEDAKAFFKYHYPNYSSSQIQQSLNRTEKVFNATYTFWGELKDKLSGQDKTFFKEGVFWYFEPFAWVTQMKNVLIPDIDLRGKVEWQTQYDSKWGDRKAQGSACWLTSHDILKNFGLPETSGYQIGAIYLAKEDAAHTKLEYLSENLQEGITYIDSQLEKGNPILIGVHHTLNYRGKNGKGGINEGTTDHFIVIVGRGYENGKKFYNFYEVGTSDRSSGENDNNKLYVYENRIEGSPHYNSKKKYIVSQVRKNKENKL